MDAAGSSEATCPRCGRAFHCGVADAASCACAGIVLAAELRAALRARFDGCLCVACLVELARARQETPVSR